MAEDIETAKADALLKASKYIAGCLTVGIEYSIWEKYFFCGSKIIYFEFFLDSWSVG